MGVKGNQHLLGVLSTRQDKAHKQSSVGAIQVYVGTNNMTVCLQDQGIIINTLQ